MNSLYHKFAEFWYNCACAFSESKAEEIVARTLKSCGAYNKRFYAFIIELVYKLDAKHFVDMQSSIARYFCFAKSICFRHTQTRYDINLVAQATYRAVRHIECNSTYRKSRNEIYIDDFKQSLKSLYHIFSNHSIKNHNFLAKSQKIIECQTHSIILLILIYLRSF